MPGAFHSMSPTELLNRAEAATRAAQRELDFANRCIRRFEHLKGKGH